jgi:hypothetical protein
MPRNGSLGVSCTIFGSVAKTDSQAILGLEAGSLAGEPGSGIHRKWLVHGYGITSNRVPRFSTATRRTFQPAHTLLPTDHPSFSNNRVIFTYPHLRFFSE